MKNTTKSIAEKRKKDKPELKPTKQEIALKKYSFFENVYAVVRLIPRGRVTSYGAIAHYLGTGKSARMVGYAMNAAHNQIEPVPAHRVVNRNGMLTGKHHFATPDLMQALLEKEKIKVEKEQIVDFFILFWNPNVELTIV